MAKKVQYVGCTNPQIGFLELLNSLLIKDSEGTVGLRTIEVTADGDTVENVVSCDTPVNLSADQILRQIVALDPSGKPAIVLIKTT